MLLAATGVHGGVLWLGEVDTPSPLGTTPRPVAVSLHAAPAREVLAALAPALVVPVAAEPVKAVVPPLATPVVPDVEPLLPSPAMAPSPPPARRAAAKSTVVQSPSPAPAAMSAVAMVVTDAAPASPAPGDAARAVAPDRDAAPVADNRPPRYPWTARLRGEQGQVVLRVWVSESGDASRLDVWQSSGSRVLDQAALAAVVKWRFQPARRDGHAADSLLHVPVEFRLDGDG